MRRSTYVHVSVQLSIHAFSLASETAGKLVLAAIKNPPPKMAKNGLMNN